MRQLKINEIRNNIDNNMVNYIHFATENNVRYKNLGFCPMCEQKPNRTLICYDKSVICGFSFIQII